MTFIEVDESSNTETKFCVITRDKHGNISRGKEWVIKKYFSKPRHFSTQSFQKNHHHQKIFIVLSRPTFQQIQKPTQKKE